MSRRKRWREYQKAVVIGSGPNGLTAAITLARAGLRTTVLEAEAQIGGGARTTELTLPGFLHDVCSAAHPFAVSSPAFAAFPLAEHGLEWIQPPLPVAHPFDDGSAAILDRSLDRTCEAFGPDGPVYHRMVQGFAKQWSSLVPEVLGPLLRIPRKPILMARFGSIALWPVAIAARRTFRTQAAQALFAGLGAHSILPLEAIGSSAFAWMLSIAAHTGGWPIPRGGSQSITTALASYFQGLGGTIIANTRVRSLQEIDESALLLCDVTPRQFVQLAGESLPADFRHKMNAYRYGPGVFKVDWALNTSIPWKASECAQAATVHVGGTLDEIAYSERAPWTGSIIDRPFVLVVQPSLFDQTRAPAGRHTAWAYCHVPHASTAEMTAIIENQIERFAPGFRDCILARHCFAPADMERHNANLIGGDITGGAQNLRQLVFRPTRSLYRTPMSGVYLCSSATPPGGGVHGMCGFHAARRALEDAGL